MPLDLRDPAYRIDPYPTLARAREAEPVHRDSWGIWYVLRHADVVAVQKDARLGRDLRKWLGYAMVRPYLADSALERCIEQWMFSLDPPAHTRLRKLVARAFTPRALEAVRPFIVAAANELLDELEASGRPEAVELMTAFAQAFPVRVIAHILGLSIDDYAALKAWSDAAIIVVEPTARRKQMQAADAAVIEMMQYLRAQAARRRTTPGNDVISTLLRAAEDGDTLSEEELISQLVLMFVAGHETTANLIGNGMLALARHPAELERLRADPSLMPAAIEEMLRYDPSANTNARAAHVELEIGGITIPAGSLVINMLGAANRDPDVFSDPDRFDVGRAPNPHVSFGGGIHFCLGAQLARIEGAVAFEALLARFASIEVDEAGVLWKNLINVRGLESLPLRVGWR
ncbi:MAG: cytochrome P450 [Myxococcales bacterium]|nr:cytochrome P450 [Myxococcales bacterium]